MAKRLVNKKLLNVYYQGDMTIWLFKSLERHLETSVYIFIGIFGMEVTYKQVRGRMDLDYGKELEKCHPRQILTRKTELINAESVRKLFGAENYSEMISRIKERFHGPTAYDDLINCLTENGIIEDFDSLTLKTKTINNALGSFPFHFQPVHGPFTGQCPE